MDLNKYFPRHVKWNGIFRCSDLDSNKSQARVARDLMLLMLHQTTVMEVLPQHLRSRAQDSHWGDHK